MKILVTGSTGLVGSEAVKFFVEKGWVVVGIDSNMRSYFFGTPRKEGSLDIDIRDEAAINTLFIENKFDAIIHTAAQPSHDWAKKEPLTDLDINARGTLILLEATRKYCPDAVFVHCSTDKVYGEGMIRALTERATRWHSDFPFDEYTKIDQSKHSLFGCSKLASDLYVQEYGYYFGMKTVCFRPGCITGKNHEGAEEHGFLAYLAKCIKEGKTYRIFGYKGKQVRDIIHSYDLVNAFWSFIQDPKVAAVYNMGGGVDSSCSILEAIQMIEKETGKTAITEYVEEERSGDRQWDIHDVTRFHQDYPQWVYKYTLPAIIKELCGS
jgi:CDP-paratose 2-epimerase